MDFAARMVVWLGNRPKVRAFFEDEPRVVKINSMKKDELNENDFAIIIRAAMDELGGLDRYVRPEDSVVIKPNMACCYPKEVRGLTTDPKFVVALARVLKGGGVRNIQIAEGSGVNLPQCSKYIFARTGLLAAAENEGIPLIDIKKDAYSQIEEPKNKILRSIRVSQTVFNADALFDVAVLKGYPFTQCCKNLMGILPDTDKPKMHNSLKKKVVELANAVRPTICLVDGTYGAKNHGGSNVRNLRSERRGIFLASTDPIAIDAVGAKLWGYTLDNVDLLDFAYAKEIGMGQFENMKLVEKSL